MVSCTSVKTKVIACGVYSLAFSVAQFIYGILLLKHVIVLPPLWNIVIRNGFGEVEKIDVNIGIGTTQVVLSIFLMLSAILLLCRINKDSTNFFAPWFITHILSYIGALTVLISAVRSAGDYSPGALALVVILLFVSGILWMFTFIGVYSYWRQKKSKLADLANPTTWQVQYQPPSMLQPWQMQQETFTSAAMSNFLPPPYSTVVMATDETTESMKESTELPS